MDALRALYVEDEPFLREVSVEIAQEDRPDIILDVAEDFKGAAELLVGPHVVVTDFHYPGVANAKSGGKELHKEWCQLPEDKRPAFVIFSGGHPDEIRRDLADHPVPPTAIYTKGTVGVNLGAILTEILPPRPANGAQAVEAAKPLR